MITIKFYNSVKLKMDKGKNCKPLNNNNNNKYMYLYIYINICMHLKT